MTEPIFTASNGMEIYDYQPYGIRADNLVIGHTLSEALHEFYNSLEV